MDTKTSIEDELSLLNCRAWFDRNQAVNFAKMKGWTSVAGSSLNHDVAPEVFNKEGWFIVLNYKIDATSNWVFAPEYSGNSFEEEVAFLNSFDRSWPVPQIADPSGFWNQTLCFLGLNGRSENFLEFSLQLLEIDIKAKYRKQLRAFFKDVNAYLADRGWGLFQSPQYKRLLSIDKDGLMHCSLTSPAGSFLGEGFNGAVWVKNGHSITLTQQEDNPYLTKFIVLK